MKNTINTVKRKIDTTKLAYISMFALIVIPTIYAFTPPPLFFPEDNPHEEKKEQTNQTIESLNETISRNPNDANTYYNLGLLYNKIGDYEHAIHALEKTIELNSHHGEAHSNLARILSSQNRQQEAIHYYQRAISLNNEDQQIIFEFANLLTKENQFDEAISLYQQLLAKDSNQLNVICNLAHVLRYQGKMKQSIPYYRLALTGSDHPTTHYGLAEAHLTTGSFETGWEEFEWRWKRATDSRNFSEKYWDGSNIAGKKILLRAEYGQGDTIQFIRYAKLIKDKGAKVLVEAQHTLTSLLKLCPYIDQVIPIVESLDQLPYFDVQIPLMSLPKIFKTTEYTVPKDIPYLYAKQTLIEHWAEQLAQDKNFKIGICWEGSPYYELFKSSLSKKVIALEQFIPLMRKSGISVYSLQKMNGLEQLNELPADVTIHTFDDFDYKHGRFMDTAALIKNMDLVISVDTSVAHLAGALGTPVWTLLPYVADWRWMQYRTDSLWYPTMRLFRQAEPGNWQLVIQMIINEIDQLLIEKQSNDSSLSDTNTNKKSRETGSTTAEISIGELIDKMTILKIKTERIHDPNKVRNVHNELTTLQQTYDEHITSNSAIDSLIFELEEVNKELWDIEDAIREKESVQTFDQQFIDLARSVYLTNDKRSNVKRSINMLLQSRLIEEKSYTNYQK